MSRADLAAGSAVRASGQTIETAPRSASTRADTSSRFPELLTKMAMGGNPSPSRPTISISEPRMAWDTNMSPPEAALGEMSEGIEPSLAVVPESQSEPSADTKDQPPAWPQPAAPSLPDATSVDSTPLLPGAVHMPIPIPMTAGIGVSQVSAVGQNNIAFPQVPTPDGAAGTSVARNPTVGQYNIVFPQVPTSDAAALKAAARGVQADLIGAPQGAQQTWDMLASAPSSAADAATLKEVPQDLRAAVGNAAIAAQLVSAVAQETHIALVVQPSLAPGARYRAERATVANEAVVPEQGTELGDAELPAARVDVPAAGKPLRPSPEQPAPVAKPADEQGVASNADGEPVSLAPPTDRYAPALGHEPPRTAGAVPSPSHQVAGQIVSTALAVQREEAQPVGALAAKPLAPSVVKVLRLELQPADLGTITIRMSLKQDALDIRVEASRYDTARMLQRDQDSLAKMLTSAGYRIDGMAVVASASDGAAVQDGRSQAFLPSPMPQHSGSSQPDSRSSGGRSNAEPDPRSSHGKQNDDDDKSRPARGPGGDLYV
jgi:chemotaxis protein MotD